MAELMFFMTDRDTGEFVDFLIGEFKACFAMDESATAELPVFEATEALLAAVARSPYGARFWVLSDRWQKYPLVVSEVSTNDGRRFFCADQRHGGPAFDFIVRRHIKDGGADHIVNGALSDFPWYIKDTAYLDDRTKYETFARPPEMKRASGLVQNYLRRHGKRTVCRETGKPGPWALPDALEAFRRGTWLRTGNWHFEPKATP